MDRDLPTQSLCSGAGRHRLNELDLENRLAELDDDGFQWLEREVQSVTAVEHDPNAEVLVPLEEAT